MDVTPVLRVIYVIVAVLSGASAILTWKKRDSTAEAWMAVTLTGLTLWSVTDLVLTLTDSVQFTYLLASILYPLAIYVPIGLLLFTVYFTGAEDWTTRPRLAAIVGYPLLLLPITLSEDAYRHELAFVDLQYNAPECAPEVICYEFGPMLYLFGFTSHVIGLIGMYLLYLKVRRSRNVYRKLSFQVLAATTALLIANVSTFLFRPFAYTVRPFGYMGLVPLAFLLFSVSTFGTTLSVRFVQTGPIDALYSKLSSLFGDIVPLARDIVIEEIDSGVIVVDEDNRIVDVNTMGRRILAPEGDRVVGKLLQDVVSEELFVSDATEILEPGTTGRFDAVWIEGLDGTERCYDISLTEVQPTESESTGARVALVHDVTEREQRKRRLEAQNEKLDDFASMVSHDLRNPLNVAEGYVEALRAELDEDDEAIERYADEISISHRRMREIIEDVLVLAREGQSVDETEPVPLADLSSTAWSNVETDGAVFDTGLDDGATVEANRSSLLRVLENLFRNAVEHGTSGNGTVTVRVGLLDGADGFYVEDTGSGIPEDEREKVLEHAYTTSEEGTGFGLSIVTEIAEGHGWRVQIAESTEGGARFEFRGVGVQA